jgi:hypothetical protein
MKEHFVKIAVTLIGKDKSIEIIRKLGYDKKMKIKKINEYINEILSCDYIDTKEELSKDVVKEINYGN